MIYSYIQTNYKTFFFSFCWQFIIKVRDNLIHHQKKKSVPQLRKINKRGGYKESAAEEVATTILLFAYIF